MAETFEINPNRWRPTGNLRECVMLFNSGHKERWLEQEWVNDLRETEWRRIHQHLLPVPDNLAGY